LSDTEKLPLAEASDEQVRSFLTEFLQVELTPEQSASRAHMEAALTKVWTQPWITVAAEPEAAVQAAGPTASPTPKVTLPGVLAKYSDQPMVELEIGETSYPGGAEPAAVIVNGDRLVIQRNQRTKIPYSFYEALKHSHQVDIRQDPNTMQLTEQKVTNYPVSHLVLPPQAEIDAWVEKSSKVVLGGNLVDAKDR
jgi:hypothetical protein